jgi:hypothetical protein
MLSQERGVSMVYKYALRVGILNNLAAQLMVEAHRASSDEETELLVKASSHVEAAAKLLGAKK